MSLFKGIFSEEYNEFLEYKDKVRSLVKQAQEGLKGTTLYGRPIDLNNPEHLIAALYSLYRDKERFHEPFF